MVDPTPAIRYIKSQLILYTILLLFYMQEEPHFQVPKANPRVDRCSGVAPSLNKGNRKGRQGSESSSASDDPVASVVDPETLANGSGPLIGPSLARNLDKRQDEENGVKKDDKGSLNIKIHLDLHAKVKLDLEADLYGDIVIGLL